MIDRNTQTWREIKKIVEDRVLSLKEELCAHPLVHDQNADTARRVRIDELTVLMETLEKPND